MQTPEDNIEIASEFLKGMANPHRLLILCKLSEGELCVGDLVELTGIPQTSMSQHLGRLRQEGIVDFRREHRTLYYYISSSLVMDIMAILHDEFCKEETGS